MQDKTDLKVTIDWVKPDGTAETSIYDERVQCVYTGSWVSVTVLDEVDARPGSPYTVYHYNSSVIHRIILAVKPQEGVGGGDIDEFLRNMNGGHNDQNHQ